MGNAGRATCPSDGGGDLPFCIAKAELHEQFTNMDIDEDSYHQQLDRLKQMEEYVHRTCAETLWSTISESYPEDQVIAIITALRKASSQCKSELCFWPDTIDLKVSAKVILQGIVVDTKTGSTLKIDITAPCSGNPDHSYDVEEKIDNAANSWTPMLHGSTKKYSKKIVATTKRLVLEGIAKGLERRPPIIPNLCSLVIEALDAVAILEDVEAAKHFLELALPAVEAALGGPSDYTVLLRIRLGELYEVRSFLEKVQKQLILSFTGSWL
jgi:hypothetical protein